MNRICMGDEEELINQVKVLYEDDDSRKVKCFCGEISVRSFVTHMKKSHPEIWEHWCLDFVNLRNKGWPNRRIMWKYNAVFSWTVIEHEVKKMVEDGKAELKVHQKPKIDEWQPQGFQLEKTTLWDFPKRGDWNVHQNNYRGNWAPELPRNLIFKYTKEGDTVLDVFVGGGTTLIEAWLAGRKSIGIDISPHAIKETEERIKEMEVKSKSTLEFNLKQEDKPILIKGDARKAPEILKEYMEEPIDLICTHPPYLDALSYTVDVEDDLSHIHEEEIFYNQMQVVANGFHAVLKDGGRCAILIGDVRKNKLVIPIGFEVMKRFKDEGFELEEIIIKSQHRDQSTEFYFNSNNLNYLISHEYLLIFQKPKIDCNEEMV
jgi:DNA modification methylase